MALRDTLDKVASFELMGAPVGGAFTLAMADVLAGAFIDLVQGYINLPPIVSGIGLSVIDRKYIKSERWLGDKLSLLMNLGFCRRAIDDQFKISERIDELVRKILPSGTSSISIPTPATEGISGVSESSSIGEMPSPSIGEVSSSDIGQIGLKAADVLELRKKRIEAYK